MKTKILAILLIISSFISGIIGTFFTILYLPDLINLSINTKNENQIIKEKVIEKTINLSNIESSITKIAKNISPSVVSIIVKKDLVVYKDDPFGFFRQPIGNIIEKVGGGTGFFILKDGTIITNKHVIIDKEAIYTVITNDGKEYDAKVLAIDPSTDLAILKIDINNEIMPLEMIKDESEINIGEFAIAVGNALGELQNSVSLGVVSGKNRTIKDFNANIYGLIQTDTAINPGNSGGPLVNLDGKVMGINTAIANNSEGIGFSIILTDKRIKYILDSIKKYGVIKKPFIGINYTLINNTIKDQYKLNSDIGAYILDQKNAIVEGSNASKSGLEPGDIILKIDSKTIDQNNNLSDLVNTKIPGDKIELEVLKKDKTIKKINFELGEI